jgi:hypothetical protein
MKLPNWQHHSKKEQKRSLKPQALRQAKKRRAALKAKLVASAVLLVSVASPALAHHRHPHVIDRYSYMRDRDWSTCTKEEVHVTLYSDGTSMKEFRRHPWQRCINKHRHGHHHHHSSRRPKVVAPAPQKQHQTDDNSCIEGSVLGGIAGGGLGAALSRGNGRWWAIPSGIVGGALVGCQIDGG